jgi:hypothetical protein
LAINSKNGNSEIINSVYESFVSNNNKIMPNINKASAIKGDYVIIMNGVIFIVDAKNYFKITGKMHPPTIYGNTTFVKTVYSNIKYALFYNLNELDPIFQDLYNCILTKNVDKLYNMYSTPKVVKTISVSQMADIVMPIEIGFALNEKVNIEDDLYNISKTKFFIQSDGEKFVISKLDFSKIPADTKIKIELYVSPKRYTYISFLMDGIVDGVETTTCIYSMSMRDITKKILRKNGTYTNEKVANCSFVNSCILETFDSSKKTFL